MKPVKTICKNCYIHYYLEYVPSLANKIAALEVMFDESYNKEGWFCYALMSHSGTIGQTSNVPDNCRYKLEQAINE